mgnify:FL=1
MLILLSAIWGSAFFAIKISVETINPITVASLRLIIGSIILFLYFKYKDLKFIYSKKIIFQIFLIGFIGNFIPFSLISWSEMYIQSNTAGLLLSVAPILTLIFSHFLTKDDKFSLLKFLSIIIGLIGVLFIFDIQNLIYNSDSSKFIIPKLFIIIAAVGYVISSILAYNMRHMNSVTLTTFVTIFAALISIPFLIYFEFKSISSYSLNSMISLFYLGAFPTALAFLIRFHIIAKAGPIFLSYVAYLIPVFAILWGYIFLNEKINSSTLVGVILILLGVFISQKNLVMQKITQKSIGNN